MDKGSVDFQEAQDSKVIREWFVVLLGLNQTQKMRSQIFSLVGLIGWYLDGAFKEGNPPKIQIASMLQ